MNIKRNPKPSITTSANECSDHQKGKLVYSWLNTVKKKGQFCIEKLKDKIKTQKSLKEQWNIFRTKIMGRDLNWPVICLVGGVICLSLAGGIIVSSMQPLKVTSEETLLLRTNQDLKWFEFQVEGENYQVPMPMERLKNTGWVVSDNALVAPKTNYPISVRRDNAHMLLLVRNEDKTPRKVEDCTVVQVTIKDSKNEADTLTYYGKDGFTLRMDYDRIKNHFGKYSKAERKGELYIYTYYYGSAAAIQIELDSQKGVTGITYNRS